MPKIRATIESVVAKVNHSDGATEAGRDAINASAADVAHQRDLAEEAKQSAYFLVDFANFVRGGLKNMKAAGRMVGVELGGLGADAWRAFRRGAPRGIEKGAAQSGKALVVGGVAGLMHFLGSDIAALGAMTSAYVPLHDHLEKLSAPVPEAPTMEPEAPAPPPGADDQAPKRRASKSRARKSQRRGKLP